MRKGYFMHSSGSFHLATISLLLVILMLGAKCAFIANSISIEVSKSYMEGKLIPTELSTLRVCHRRTAVWIAKTELANGIDELGVRLLQESAKSGSVLAADLLANAYFKSGELGSALDYWQQASDFASVLLAAKQLQDSGKDSDALHAYQVALQMNGERTALPFARFLAYRIGDTSTAIALLDREIGTGSRPEATALWEAARGDIFRSSGDWRAAKSAYELSLSLDSSNPDAWIGLAWSEYFSDRDETKAMEAMNTAISLTPNTADGYLELGKLLLAVGHAAEGEHWLSVARAKCPSCRDIYLYQGKAALSDGHVDEAVQDLSRATELFPDFAEAWYVLSWAYYRHGDMINARQAISAALRTAKLPSSYFYSRAGLIFEQSGAADQALDYFRQSLELDPSNQVALDGISRLSPTSDSPAGR